MISGTNEELATENANKNVTVVSTQRDYFAGEVSKEYAKKYIYPADVLEAHSKGWIHIHDLDFAANLMTNCCLCNLEDMLQNGTVMNGTRIFKPKSLLVATTIATQIIMAVSASQFGGQSVNLAHLAPFVDVSRQKIRHALIDECHENGINMTSEQIDKVTESRLLKEIKDSVQTFNHQVVSMSSGNGQAPFITLFMYLGDCKDERTKHDLALLIEEFFKQRIVGLPNEQGINVSPTFPKIVYVLEEDNIHEDSKYWYLTELAAECSARRLVPDYISEKIMKQLKVDENGEGHCFSPMGCRSFLSTYVDGNNKPKYWGRFNMGVVTINLPHLALSAKGNIEDFWRILDERAKLVLKTHLSRVKHLEKATSDVAPILWQHGAIARLKKGEPISNLFYNGYATISMGYAGLYETVYALIGKSHTTEEGQELAIQIMKKLNKYCDEWKEQTGLGFSLYGTPLESTTGKLANALRRDFGEIEGITNHEYVTNSYHISVREDIDAFSKLDKESVFQALSPGGAISYVEVPDMTKNIPAVLEVIKHIYNTIMYAELNTRSDLCMECGYDGEITQKRTAFGEFVWECPNCGNRDMDKMSIVRRTCGYLSNVKNGVSSGRQGDYADRVFHL